MRKIQGMTLEEFIEIVSNGSPKDEKQSATDLVHSVLGRLYLSELKHHECDKKCDPLMLIAAEQMAAKRKLNKKALSFLYQRFIRGARRHELDTEELLKRLQQDYFKDWLNEHFDLLVQALHKEIEIEEVFNEGPFIETWAIYTDVVYDS